MTSGRTWPPVRRGRLGVRPGRGRAIAFSACLAGAAAAGCSSQTGGTFASTAGFAAPQPAAAVARPWGAPVVHRAAAAAPATVASSGAGAGPEAAPGPLAVVPKIKGVYKIGQPYEVNGRVFVPADDPRYDMVGLASWYGTGFHGKPTANGELYDLNALTAAHPTLPMPSYVYVTNLRNGRTVLVRVNDRGPFKPDRIIDLSRGVARALAFEGQGTAQVRVRYAGPAPLEPDDRRERRHLAAQAWGRTLAPPQGFGLASADTVAPTRRQ